MSTLVLFTMLIVMYLLGRFSGGVTITINKNEQQPEIPAEYNESLVDELAPEVRNYYDNTNGLNKF